MTVQFEKVKLHTPMKSATKSRRKKKKVTSILPSQDNQHLALNTIAQFYLFLNCFVTGIFSLSMML